MPPRVRSLRLVPGWTTEKITLANRARCAQAALRQVARCEAILAAEPKRVPRWRRCDTCQGLEDTRHPHRHVA